MKSYALRDKKVLVCILEAVLHINNSQKYQLVKTSID
jgi:hypothetical protein